MVNLCLLVVLLCSTGVVVGECPHPKFLHDHVCSNCWEAEDALEFSRNRLVSSNVNTVLVFEEEDQSCNQEFKIEQSSSEELCVTEQMVSVIWECRTDRGYCNKKGVDQLCKIQHATRNGHFFYKKLQCQPMSTPEL